MCAKVVPENYGKFATSLRRSFSIPRWNFCVWSFLGWAWLKAFKFARRLQELRLTLHSEKCCFRKSWDYLLRSSVRTGFIKPTLDKVKAIQDRRPSTWATELQSFLGLVTYVGIRICNFLETGRNCSVIPGPGTYPNTLQIYGKFWKNSNAPLTMRIRKLVKHPVFPLPILLTLTLNNTLFFWRWKNGIIKDIIT